MAKKQVTIYGRHAVLAALANPERQINKLMVTKDNLLEVKGKIPDNKISVVDRKEIDKLLPKEATHQGFALTAFMLDTYALEEICDMAETRQKSHVLILDQVTDPRNVGAIIRSCAAFDALALVVQDKNSPDESGALLKAAAGTFEDLPICRVTNLSRTIDILKRAGFWTVGMDGHAQTSVEDLPKDSKIAIIMGSEGKGMRRLVEESCDMTIKLPINPKVESLNVATAASVVLYEVNKNK